VGAHLAVPHSSIIAEYRRNLVSRLRSDLADDDGGGLDRDEVEFEPYAIAVCRPSSKPILHLGCWNCYN
jgi:hypothetical protein